MQKHRKPSQQQEKVTNLERSRADHRPDFQHVSWPAAILQLQQSVGNRAVRNLLQYGNDAVLRQRYPVLAPAIQRQGGKVMVGAAAQTPTKSVGEYGQTIIKLLKEDKNRKLSIQDAMRKAADAQAGRLSAPTVAEAGGGDKFSVTGNKLAFIITNSDYQDPNTDLPKTKKDGDGMASQLKSRKFKTQRLTDQKAADMSSALGKFVEEGSSGDDLVIFYSGHGEVEGIQGVDNKYVSPATVNGWKDKALNTGFRLTIILEACHTGSTTDFIRKKESTRIAASEEGKGPTKALLYATIAQELQTIKDKLAKLERAKQALMEKPLIDQLMKANKHDSEIKKRSKAINDAWEKDLPEIKKLAKDIEKNSGEKLTVPTFPKESEWLNTKQLTTLDKMINRCLELSREAMGP